MKKILLTFAVVISALLAVFAAACKPDGKQTYNGYTVTLNAQTLSLGVFETAELTAEVKDAQNNVAEKTVIWRSADESVAKVTDGKIIATGAGTTEVSAALDKDVSAKCVVTVTDNGVIPELRVNSKSLTVGKGQKFTVIAKVFFNGKDCTESDTEFTFKSLQDGIATVSRDGVIEAVAAGETKITVYALWRGMGGTDKTGDAGVVAALTATVDVKVIDL